MCSVAARTRQDDHLPGVVDDHEVLQPLVRHVRPTRDEPLPDTVVGERVEEVLEERLVADLDGAQQHVEARSGRPVDLQFLGILAPLAGDERLVLVDELALLGLADEPRAELRVRDGGKLHRPFADVLAVQVGDAVLRDDVVDVAPDQRDAGALIEHGHDPRYLVVPRRGGEGQDRACRRAQDGAAHEVRLPADPAVERLPERHGRGLAGQVDLERGVDGGHVSIWAIVSGLFV